MPFTPDITLYSTVVKLIAIQDGQLPATQGRLAHAAFLDIIRAVDPALADALHASRGRKPFTVSPLWGLPRWHDPKGQVTVRRGHPTWLRFTLLGSQLFTTFTRRFLSPLTPSPSQGEARGAVPPFQAERRAENPPSPTRGGAGGEVPPSPSQAERRAGNPPSPRRGGAGGEVRIGNLDFAITEILTTPGSHPWAGYTSLSELYRRWQSPASVGDESARKIALEFASPIVFSRGSDKEGMGKFMEPFPAPAMFFGSVAAMWNEHLPAPLSLSKQAIRQYAEETIVVGLYKMESQMFRYWGSPQIGATGKMTYLLKDKDNHAMIRTLNMLADFAFYSGAGYKTTMGMGQCRRIVR
jgi:CRISPR-associated endoribonuclease Cas6